ncbi:TlpA family protein disulfide reductase [Flavobacterium sp. MFBS3-15]|uniref:peroxiredoxin family protein n=1 Tax=Flavobacterium sp. MFBS3-15 TaxID=2989816 RepID=UPI002235E259|nr:TlpA disulfide reductase family protein [Flavobacterium sp. MFBS3-15]MCW4468308.1 TlpA family protein disulfide reductase [Flavobacterium sp. MFBS3-15]
MRQKLLWTLLIISTSAFSQDYPFLSASSKRTTMSDYVDYLNALPKQTRDSLINSRMSFKEDGTTYTKAYSDSIAKAKNFYRYTTRVYKDTIAKTFTYVMHWRTDAEMEADGKAWKQSTEEDEKNRKKLKGSKLDELALIDMDGNTHTLETLAGKIIVIDFWFVNCSACIEEMPELNKMREKFGTEDVAWFGITFDKKEKVVKFSEKIKFDFTLIPDSKHLVDRFGIKFFPTTLIINPDHEIVYTGKLGAMSGRADEIKKALKKTVKKEKKTKRVNVTAGPVERIE